MSRLWSRFGIRTMSVGLLAVAVIGGTYLSRDREAQQRGIDAGVAVEAHLADQQMIKDRAAARAVATSRKRAAEREAAEKAAAAAKAAAQRAKRVNEAATRKKAEEKAESTGSAGRSKRTVPYTGPIPASCDEYSGNRRTGCALLLKRGFAIKQMPCLDKLWTRESGWNHKARNPSTGAGGIPQALPASKMSSAGDDWETNPATQIRWGLGYIKGRYGTPCEAWGHFQDVGWY